QRAYVYRNGVPIGVTTVSTGKVGHKTPTGVFTVLQKRVVHKSNRYSNAPMPFMQRLTWYGIAMHAGNLPGYPASHGCIRLPLAFAKLLYGITSLGLTVVITNDALVPEVSPQPRITQRDSLAGAQVAGAFTWQPEKSPSGPVSIVVSGRDRRLVVLRNGVRIGSAPIELDEPVATTVAFVLRSVDAAGPHWLRLVLPGQPKVAAGELNDVDRAKGRVPEEFQRLLTSILEPGATILVTRDTLRSGGTGKALTVITGSN
ncbi:MAG: L,D-transpeptidase, partial [Gemmatimonadaceae bacterium]|nr:L,D-transpeptidase [Acetobacteraceae bacterium]